MALKRTETPGQAAINLNIGGENGRSVQLAALPPRSLQAEALEAYKGLYGELDAIQNVLLPVLSVEAGWTPDQLQFKQQQAEGMFIVQQGMNEAQDLMKKYAAARQSRPRTRPGSFFKALIFGK